jgi:omega-6 fatty acid desaturase (delta-12 desaturase)
VDSPTTESGFRAQDGTSRARSLRAAAAAYQAPILRTSLWQVATSFLPFVITCAAMHAGLAAGLPYWAVLPLVIPAAGLVVRIFIIQHDCGHGAYFRSRRANDALGRLCSLITFTPYGNWRRQHAAHHGNWNNLDRRQSGADIYSTCLTVSEYRRLGRWRRLAFQAIRTPLVMHVLIPPLIFLLLYRFPFDTPRTWRRERISVYATNLALLAVAGGLGMALGFRAVLLVQLPIVALAGILGVWLFSIQHRFQGAVWTRQEGWTMEAASLEGSSYLKLPALLHWFTGNIGFHHVHHLNPRVPNYRLRACHEAVPGLRDTPPLGLWRALGAFRFSLWDDALGRLVSTHEAARLPRDPG